VYIRGFWRFWPFSDLIRKTLINRLLGIRIWEVRSTDFWNGTKFTLFFTKNRLLWYQCRNCYVLWRFEQICRRFCPWIINTKGNSPFPCTKWIIWHFLTMCPYIVSGQNAFLNKKHFLLILAECAKKSAFFYVFWQGSLYRFWAKRVFEKFCKKALCPETI